jgi:hypothetical protein
MQETLFTTIKLEDFVPADHPLRPVRLLFNEALKRLSGLFNTIYADSGRASSRQAGYPISQVIRKRIQEHFGWGKTVARRQACRSAVQADDGCEQSDRHGPNIVCGATRSNAMSRQDAVPARTRAASANRATYLEFSSKLHVPIA